MGCNCSNHVRLENENKKPISVCVLGLLNSGKTSIIEYLAGEYNINNPPIHTNGVVIWDLPFHNILFRFYDIGSFGASDSNVQESINSSNAALYVIDGHTFQYNLKAFNELLETSSPSIVKRHLPIAVIINKAKDEATDNSQQQIEKAIESYFGSETKKKYIKMSQIDDSIFPVFQWIHDNVQ